MAYNLAVSHSPSGCFIGSLPGLNEGSAPASIHQVQSTSPGIQTKIGVLAAAGLASATGDLSPNVELRNSLFALRDSGKTVILFGAHESVRQHRREGMTALFYADGFINPVILTRLCAPV